MRTVIIINLIFLAQVNSQFWKFPQEIFDGFSWMRRGKTGDERMTTLIPSTTGTVTGIKLMNKISSSGTQMPKTTRILPSSKPTAIIQPVKKNISETTYKIKQTTAPLTTFSQVMTKTTDQNSGWTTILLTTKSPTVRKSTTIGTTTRIQKEPSTLSDITTQDVTGTTEEPRDNHQAHDFYLSKREKPQVKIASNISQVSFLHLRMNYSFRVRKSHISNSSKKMYDPCANKSAFKSLKNYKWYRIIYWYLQKNCGTVSANSTNPKSVTYK